MEHPLFGIMIWDFLEDHRLTLATIVQKQVATSVMDDLCKGASADGCHVGPAGPLRAIVASINSG